ncbi:hypothetical protein D3D02_08215 [Halobellus sp. Atlit-38R]|uniref:hypothetical protein n=1 Tax=Halobellus sp. Atlit-38R TaxID=2282131 RepID=UPI000EF1D132|nr:hypothetical protein [Halobellus sp. Atlit-38R]RLM89835.1 hypothetical protein D3D02_08215 [Halobellus sp. Atlit-38R]
MSLHQRFRDRLRPWHLLDLAAFLFGAGWSLWRNSAGFETTPPLFALVTAIVSGLLAVVVLRFTLGNLWGYAVEYANAGGQWSDLAFLVPVGSGLAGVVVTYAVTTDLGAAAWAGFWTFAVVAGVVAVAVSFAAGYRGTSA